MANDIEIGWRTQTSGEVRPWAFDLTAELDPLDVPASATATLTDLLTGLAYPSGLSGSPVVVAPVVTQTVTGLVAGHSYRLVILTNMGGSKQTASVLNLRVPY